MNILFVYPQYPNTFWSFEHALKFISKKASQIPLGVITVASMLPKEWNRRVVDLNCSELTDKQIMWADYVFISAMSIQTASVEKVIDHCKQLGKKIVAGGPLFIEEYDKFPEVDHLVLNEAEITLPRFIEDLLNGNPKSIYRSNEFADVKKTPIPSFSLLELDKYASAAIQFSRGCPYDCEFCDITALFGRRVRTKSALQIISELDNLFEAGWRGSVMFVDDNFIGNRKKLKKELLPALTEWMRSKKYPFVFATEASINLSDDKELMQMMVEAGFIKVFVGIESPDEDSLKECNKVPNNNRDMISCINRIQQAGLEVTGGFIVGFDHDPPNIFQRQIDFIQNSGIVTAMVGLLNAPRLSKLYSRLHREGRLTHTFSGNNTGLEMNFQPVMNKEDLMKGYMKIIQDIYSHKLYYERVSLFLKNFTLPANRQKLTANRLVALMKSVFIIGIMNNSRRYYWQLLFWCMFHSPKKIPMAITFSIYGYHFMKMYKEINNVRSI